MSRSSRLIRVKGNVTMELEVEFIRCRVGVNSATQGQIWESNPDPLIIFLWPRGLRHGPAADHLLGFRVQVPPGHGWMSVVSVVCVVRLRSLQRTDHSSRGVLVTAVCLSVTMKPR